MKGIVSPYPFQSNYVPFCWAAALFSDVCSMKFIKDGDRNKMQRKGLDENTVDAKSLSSEFAVKYVKFIMKKMC